MITRVVLTASLIAGMAQASPIVGLWDSARTSAGGIGTTLEFRPDGAFIEATTVIVNAYYRVVGDRLLIEAQPISDQPPADAGVSIEIEDDLFRMTGPDGSVIEKRRLGVRDAGKPPIAGAWQYRHSTGVTAFERYTEDGLLQFRLPMTSTRGRYVLNGAELVMTRPNQPDMKMTLALAGDVLALSGNGRTSEYGRDAGGPWYDRESGGK